MTEEFYLNSKFSKFHTYPNNKDFWWDIINDEK